MKRERKCELDSMNYKRVHATTALSIKLSRLNYQTCGIAHSKIREALTKRDPETTSSHDCRCLVLEPRWVPMLPPTAPALDTAVAAINFIAWSKVQYACADFFHVAGDVGAKYRRPVRANWQPGSDLDIDRVNRCSQQP